MAKTNTRTEKDYLSKMHIREIIECYEKALKITRQRRKETNETRAYLLLGDAYRLNNQIQTAIEYYEKSLRTAQEREDGEN